MAQINAEGNLEPVQDLSLCVYYFQGLYRDEETHFYYVRNRYYDARQGRWCSRDPSGYLDSMGMYESFGGNPINIRDIFGDRIILRTAPTSLGNFTMDEINTGQRDDFISSLRAATGLDIGWRFMSETGEGYALTINSLFNEINPGSRISPIYKGYILDLICRDDFNLYVGSGQPGGSESFDKARGVGYVRLSFSDATNWNFEGNDLAMLFAHESFHAVTKVNDWIISEKVDRDTFLVPNLTPTDFTNIILNELERPIRLGYAGGFVGDMDSPVRLGPVILYANLKTKEITGLGDTGNVRVNNISEEHANQIIATFGNEGAIADLIVSGKYGPNRGMWQNIDLYRQILKYYSNRYYSGEQFYEEYGPGYLNRPGRQKFTIKSIGDVVSAVE